jgi:hypothetical protein
MQEHRTPIIVLRDESALGINPLLKGRCHYFLLYEAVGFVDSVVVSEAAWPLL